MRDLISKKIAVIKQNRKKSALFAFLILLILGIPFLTIQPFNQPFDKLALRMQRPPDLSQVKKENNNGAVLATDSGKVKYPDDFTIILLGDSMTERLGNADEIRGYLSEYYHDKSVEVLNYGYGATNILSVNERLLNNTNNFRAYRPITEIDYDLIIIESFANNPLSEYPVEQGLALQEQKLDETVAILRKQNPRGKIAFLATIAPNKRTYAQGSIELSQEARNKWVDERIAYMTNHINYAKKHNIPLINVYKDSQDFFGDGKMIYIDDEDFIHPSPLGVIFISKKIAEQINQQNLLPHENN